MNHTIRRATAPLLLLGASAAGFLPAQTKVDLRTQSKSVDFQDATMTRPMRTASALPAQCTANELLFLTTAPAGSNFYACISGAWVPEAASPGTVTIQNGGASVGARQTENFVPGTGVVNAITDIGTKINIQQSVDTAVIVSKSALQSGQALACISSSGDTPPAYGCSLQPGLTTYTQGMVLNWIPSGNGTSGVSTLNVDLLGAVPVVRADGVTPATGTDIVGGRMYSIWYDGNSFRLPSGDSAGGTSGGTSASPSVIVSTGSGGTTTVTGTVEWHSQLAACVAGAGAVLTWNPPPTGGTAPTAAGCTGTEVMDAYASFPASGTPALQNSFILPKNLTGKADISIYYVATAPNGAFTPVVDLVCGPGDSTAVNEGSFSGASFFVPGTVTGPALAGSLASVTGTALNWPTGCVGGSRAHLRLSRANVGGTPSVNIAEMVLTMRRTM